MRRRTPQLSNEKTGSSDFSYLINIPSSDRLFLVCFKASNDNVRLRNIDGHLIFITRLTGICNSIADGYQIDVAGNPRIPTPNWINCSIQDNKLNITVSEVISQRVKRNSNQSSVVSQGVSSPRTAMNAKYRSRLDKCSVDAKWARIDCHLIFIVLKMCELSF